MNIECIIVVLGAMTVILSAWAAIIFFKTRTGSHDTRRMSKALGWQLLGEACIGGGTMFFAVAALQGWLEALSGDIQSSVRFVMFLATSTTTLHLMRVLKRLS